MIFSCIKDTVSLKIYGFVPKYSIIYFSTSGESCDLINQINPHYKSSPKWQFLWVVKDQPEVICLLFVVPYHINDISFETNNNNDG